MKYLELEKSRQQLQNKQEENEEVKELDREGEKEDAEDAIVSTKPVSFFEVFNRFSFTLEYKLLIYIIFFHVVEIQSISEKQIQCEDQIQQKNSR